MDRAQGRYLIRKQLVVVLILFEQPADHGVSFLVECKFHEVELASILVYLVAELERQLGDLVPEVVRRLQQIVLLSGAVDEVEEYFLSGLGLAPVINSRICA